MKNEENRVLNETEKTVIFIHGAVHFVIDGSVISDAYHIKEARQELKETGESIFYYLSEMRAAARSGKEYLIMEYEPVIGATIEAMLKIPGHYNFCRWNFYTFFHDDSCPEGMEENAWYNSNDDKMDVLWGFCNYPFISMYVIPVGHTLTITDLQKIKKEFSGPETPKELRRHLWNMRKGIKPKPLFPYYHINHEKLKIYANEQIASREQK